MSLQTLEFHSTNPDGGYVDVKPGAVERWAKPLTLSLMLVALWSVTHRYRGLGGDAELYAVQAWAKIHSNLFHDLFLENTSQDTYTVFSPFYARCIGLWGLRNAELVLTMAFKVWFFAAAWALARRLFADQTAFLAVSLLIVIEGTYGAYSVFHYAEDWVTARSLAEALVITALALHAIGSRAGALLVACGAMFVHPLMALPGVLLLMCLWSSFPPSIIGAVSGVLLSLVIALTALRPPPGAHFFTVMDSSWLEVVRDRSQFLFLQLWSFADWSRNILPFLSLTIGAIAIDDPRIRKLCMAAMLVGATGLAVALISSLIGPVSFLLQGQAWRWVWVTEFTSVLLLAPTVLAVWRNEKCGFSCAVLMISAWTIPAIEGAACIAAALTLFLMRNRMNARTSAYLRWVAVAVGAVVVAWGFKTSSAIVWPRPARSDGEPLPMSLIRGVLGARIFCMIVIWAVFHSIRAGRSKLSLAATCAALFVISAFGLPAALRDNGRVGSPAEIKEFEDWRSAIPPDSNVFVVPAHNAPSFAWFTLERPSYLTVDQSSGVVFSRATALEVRRRSQILLPLMDPDWMLLSNMQKARGNDNPPSNSTRPVTRDRLISLCGDPDLNFIVAKEDVGFDPIRHTQPGAWKDWNLYDCRRVHA